MPNKKSAKATDKAKKGKKGGTSMMATGVGAVVGGAIGAATGAILSDEEKRGKLGQRIDEFRTSAVDAIDNVTEDASKWRDRAYDSLEGAQEETDKAAKKAKKAVRKSS